MRSKVKLASAMALAATVFTALISAHGSGAAATDSLPMMTELAANQQTAVEFESRPIVQTAPAPQVAESVEFEAEKIAADSLHELVSQHSMPEDMSKEIRCLAGAIYFEARGETLEGQLAVGNVVVNRSKSNRFPKSYCGVVYQPSQFSFVRRGTMPPIPEKSQDWQEAVAIANIAHNGTWESSADDALFFHATHVSPRWRLTRLARIDNHIFYR